MVLVVQTVVQVTLDQVVLVVLQALAVRVVLLVVFPVQVVRKVLLVQVVLRIV